MERKNQGELFGRPNAVSKVLYTPDKCQVQEAFREREWGLSRRTGRRELESPAYAPVGGGGRGAGEHSERGLDVRASLKAFEQVVQNQVSGTAVPGEGEPSLQWSGPPLVSGRTSHSRDPGRRI